MSEFDPYHKWLGISETARPVSKYRLLGIDEFESDRDVISAAAERQTVYLRTLQAGEHAVLVAELLNEVSQARVTLLSADQKAAYDEELRKQQIPHRKVQQEIWKQPAVIGVSLVGVIAVFVLFISLMFSGDAEPVASNTANPIPAEMAVETAAVEKADAEKADAEKADAEKADAVTAALAKGDWKVVLSLDPNNSEGLRMKAVADKVAAEKATADKVAAEKAAADKAAADKAAAEKAAMEKTAMDKAAAIAAALGKGDWKAALALDPDNSEGLRMKTAAQKATALKTLEGHVGTVLSVAFSRDGKQIVSGSEDKTIKIWDANTGEVLHTLTGHNGNVSIVAFSPDGKQIVSGSYDMTIKIWDAQIGRIWGTIKVGLANPFGGGSGRGSLVTALSPDGKRIATGSMYSNTIRLWDLRTGQTLGTIISSEQRGTFCLAFSPDGKRIVSGGMEGKFRIWSANTGKQLKMIQRQNVWVNSVAFSPDGKRFVSGSELGFGEVRIWDANTGEVLLFNRLAGHNHHVSSVAFSRDGKQIVSGNKNKTMKIWDANTGEVLNTLVGHRAMVTSVAFSPDGKRIVSGSADESVRIWNAN